MILLDTNVLSELMRPDPDVNVIAWLDKQPRTSVWTTSVNVLEIRFGLQVMESGKRQSVLSHAFEHLISESLQQRVVMFDTAAAFLAADLMASRQKSGRRGEMRDTMIAGIALSSRATLATRNVRHFEDLDLPVVNPWNS